jgi:hypothetical protein
VTSWSGISNPDARYPANFSFVSSCTGNSTLRGWNSIIYCIKAILQIVGATEHQLLLLLGSFSCLLLCSSVFFTLLGYTTQFLLIFLAFGLFDMIPERSIQRSDIPPGVIPNLSLIPLVLSTRRIPDLQRLSPIPDLTRYPIGYLRVCRVRVVSLLGIDSGIHKYVNRIMQNTFCW